MTAAVDWFRRETAQLDARASGRVTPQILSPVRVKLGDGEDLVKLEEVATVGVRDGSMLIVTVFESDVSDTRYILRFDGQTLSKSENGYLSR